MQTVNHFSDAPSCTAGLSACVGVHAWACWPRWRLLGACTSLADMLTPGQRNADLAPALLSFQANVALASNDEANEVVSLDVRTTYLRRDGSEVPVSTQSLPTLERRVAAGADSRRRRHLSRRSGARRQQRLLRRHAQPRAARQWRRGGSADRSVPFASRPGCRPTLPRCGHALRDRRRRAARCRRHGTRTGGRVVARPRQHARADGARARQSWLAVTDRPVSWRSECAAGREHFVHGCGHGRELRAPHASPPRSVRSRRVCRRS
jgi:hypothetical protein